MIQSHQINFKRTSLKGFLQEFLKNIEIWIEDHSDVKGKMSCLAQIAHTGFKSLTQTKENMQFCSFLHFLPFFQEQV